MEVINKVKANNEKRVDFMLSTITNVGSERCVGDKECEGGRGWPRRESNTESEMGGQKEKRPPRLKGSTYKHSKKKDCNLQETGRTGRLAGPSQDTQRTAPDNRRLIRR